MTKTKRSRSANFGGQSTRVAANPTKASKSRARRGDANGWRRDLAKGCGITAGIWMAFASCNLGHEVARNDQATLADACRELCRKDAECGADQVAVPCIDGDCSACESACESEASADIDAEDEFCIAFVDAVLECAKTATCSEFASETGAACERASRAGAACYGSLDPSSAVTGGSASSTSGFADTNGSGVVGGVGPSSTAIGGTSTTGYTTTAGGISTTGFRTTGSRISTTGTTTTTGGVTGSAVSGAGGMSGDDAGSGVSTSSPNLPEPWDDNDAWRVGDCDNVGDIFINNCSTAACHGSPGAPLPSSEPHLFPADPVAAFVGVPGEVCSNELLVNPKNPSQSLLVTTLRGTAACEVVMPSVFLLLPEQDIACVESWVAGLVDRYNAGIE